MDLPVGLSLPQSWRVPWATLALSAAILFVYFFLSGGLLFISDQQLYPQAFSLDGTPQSLLSHIFVHVGIKHLVGNVVPLLLFGALVESTVSFHLLAVFLLSGVFASLLFAFLTAGTTLVGASAAISGVMGAALAAKPRHALLFLILTPIILFFFIFPGLQAYTDFRAGQLAQQQTTLSQQVVSLVKQQRVEEAAQANASLQEVVAQAAVEEAGKKREEEVSTDTSVHLFGALFGVAYLFLVRRRAFEEGISEFRSLGEDLYSFTKSGK